MERDPKFPSWERRKGRIVWLDDLADRYQSRVSTKVAVVIYAGLVGYAGVSVLWWLMR